MREDFLEDFDPKLKEEFFRSVHNTAQLVGLKELESFRLGIDYEDADCQDLILKLKSKPDAEHVDIISQDGYSIIRRYFKHQKEKDLLDKLYSINEKYIKKNKEASRAAYTAIVLFEDRQFDKARLPLLNVILHLELLEMQEEIFADSAYFANRGKNYLREGDFQNAERFFVLERQIDGEHWDSYENMAEVYSNQGRKDESKDQIKEALKWVYKCWQEDQRYLDFEVVEEIEEKADEILERDRSAYLKRLCQYAHGLLYFFGAALLDTVEREIKSVSECKKPFSREELMYYLKEEPGIIMDGDLLYLEGIENPRLILEELSMRGLKQHSPYSLSALKLAQEGRVAEMFFTQDEDNEDIDEDLRRLTHNELNLVLAYEELRKDVTGRQHHDLFLNRLLNKNRAHAQEIVDILTYIWNNLPRWEIGGRTAADLGAKRNREGIAPQLEKYVTAFSPPEEIHPPKRKIGRNEPCPCGSGKKYKKCCGA
jgi:tetratricopeptide (TPR) repeat protein